MWVRGCVIVWIGCLIGVFISACWIFCWWEDVRTPIELAPIAVTAPAVVEAVVTESIPAWTDEELDLVMRVVMSEARGEPRDGIVGVAQTIRDRSVSWGKSVTEIVTAENQFAEPYAGGISDVVREVVLSVFLEGESVFDCRVTHFHADYVTPYWAESKVFLGSRGGTRFYTSE